ncbi:hypothetical protein [Streptomyces nojiriensis]|uniref:hypothetical protein n=1 Tax=Streptomyces nojiriensis TaxID=66374 RepID=UPI0035DC2DAB
MPIAEYPIDRNLAPRSIAASPAGWLWVTTDNNALVQINKSDPFTQNVHDKLIPQYTGGILQDPTGRKVVWFASPAGQQDHDPVYEFDTEVCRIVNKHNLQENSQAQAVSSIRFKTSGEASAPRKDYILFAEPMHTSVGFVEVGQDGANYHSLPTGTDEFSTWLAGVAATLNETQTEYTYWATGQKHASPARKTNGLYTYTPAAADAQWRRIPLPGGAEQVPGDIVAGVIEEDGTQNPYLWISARNPNQVLRYDIRNSSWTVSSTITGEPRQLAFGPDGNIWLAGTDKIYRFSKDVSLPLLPTRALPSGSEAHGICLDETDKFFWYTDPKAHKIGKFPIPDEPETLIGRTRLLEQTVKVVRPGEVADVPLVAEFVAGGDPTPGVPLTCKITSKETVFLDGHRQRVITTDATGQIAFPAVQAGNAEEGVVLEVAWGKNEPAISAVLDVRN